MAEAIDLSSEDRLRSDNDDDDDGGGDDNDDCDEFASTTVS